MQRYFIAAIVLFLASVGPRAEVEPLTIASGEHPPFVGPELQDEGIVNGYIRRMADEAGVNIEFRYMPWTRALEATRKAAYQATSYWYFSEEREVDFIHVGPVSYEEEVFFVLADSGIPEWEQLEDLQGLRIGATLGYTYTPNFWSLGDSGALSLSTAPKNISSLKKLLAGRIDIFPLSEETGWHLIRTHFTEEEQARFKTLKKPLSVHKGFLLVPRALPDSAVVAAGLQKAMDDNPLE